MIRKDVVVISVKIMAYLSHIVVFWLSKYGNILFICFYIHMSNLR